MSDFTDRFIDAAVAPLADNAELEYAARQRLAERLGSGDRVDQECLETASARLESNPRRRWMRILYGCVLLAALPMILQQSATLRQVSSAHATFELVSGGTESASKVDLSMFDGLTREQKLVVFGDLEQASPSKRQLALWNSQPDNPAYYAAYLASYHSEHSHLPDDVLEVAARLDPDNGYFPGLVASMLAEEALGEKDPASPPTLELRLVEDPAKLAKALELAEVAAQRPVWRNYEASLLRERLELLPKPRDIAEQTVMLAVVAETPSTSYQFMKLARAIRRQAVDLATRGDAAGLKKLFETNERLLRLQSANREPFFIEVLIWQALLASTSQAIGHAAGQLGLTEVASQCVARAAACKALTESRSEDPTIDARHLSMLAHVTLTKNYSPEFDLNKFEPSRFAEHALFGQTASLCNWLLLLLLLLGAMSYRFRGGALARRLSHRLLDLLDATDWRWISSAALLPIAYFHLIDRFTPFGGREFSLASTGFRLPSSQHLLLFLLLAALPILAARWRLYRRLIPLGLGSVPHRTFAVVTGAGALGLPLLGSATPAVQSLGQGLAALLVVGLLVVGLRALATSPAEVLRRATLSRALVPTYAAAMLGLTASAFLWKLDERYWVARDCLLTPTAEKPSLTSMEYENAQFLRGKFEELLKQYPVAWPTPR